MKPIKLLDILPETSGEPAIKKKPIKLVYSICDNACHWTQDCLRRTGLRVIPAGHVPSEHQRLVFLYHSNNITDHGMDVMLGWLNNLDEEPYIYLGYWNDGVI